MPTLLIGVLALALMLWLLKSFARSDPQYLAMIMTRIGRTAGGILALAGAAFLGVRGELLVALPLAGLGFSLLGWEPGRELLASYLGRWSPGWREDANHRTDDPAAGRGRPAASGKMSEQEAYQVLDLQPGANAEDIGRAHRALIKKLHPDQGGSTYLAARVNEAKEVLLRRHQ
jgi:DnaJ-like protein